MLDNKLKIENSKFKITRVTVNIYFKTSICNLSIYL